MRRRTVTPVIPEVPEMPPPPVTLADVLSPQAIELLRLFFLTKDKQIAISADASEATAEIRAVLRALPPPEPE